MKRNKYYFQQKSKRDRFDHLKTQLINERASFDPHYKDLSNFGLPRRSRFTRYDTNKGDRRNLKIIDSTATLALRTAKSGMMSGLTSPARPWFKLEFTNPSLTRLPNVKRWLAEVERLMTGVYLKSNLYNVLPTVYGDMFQFATGCVFMEEDFDEVVRFTPFPIGSYYIGNDSKYRVRVFIREFRMTVRQVVEKFGEFRDGELINEKNFSSKVLSNYDNGNHEQWVDLTHIVLPNENYVPDSPLSKHKKFSSCYYESGESSSVDEDVLLSEKGYDYFPVLVPRWEVTTGDAWGTNCPGMEALGDVKQLQHGEKKGTKAIDKMIDPPMTGPTSLRKSTASILPGDITYVDDRDGKSGFRSAHEVRFDLNALEAKQQQVRQRISRAYFEDLFLMLANSDRRQITATEIAERKEEKLLALGPVLEQVNQDLLDPLIDNTFYIMEKQGLIPEPPEEIQGQEIKVEYVSIMAQAQKLSGIGSIDRFIGFAGQLAQQDPRVAKKLNLPKTVDVYGDLTGVPVEIIRSDEEVAEMEAQEQQAMQKEKAEMQAQQLVQGAKDLSQVKTDENNMMTELMQQAGAGALT